MARYRGPVCKLCRRLGFKLLEKGDRCFSAKCAAEPSKRALPPGPRGTGRRRKLSEYAVQLREKQKVKYIYGVLERQFRRYFEEAERLPGPSGENLLRLLELRLDNTVFRLGFADSRAQARQIVTHGHFMVNGRRTNIPSMILRAGQVISVRPESLKSEYFKTVAGEIRHKTQPQWLNLDAGSLTGKVVGNPARDDVDISINEQLIVEYYSR